MKYCIACLYDDNYRDIAELTIYNNHKEYCYKYNYNLITKYLIYSSVPSGMGFEGIEFLKYILYDYDWVCFVGVDTLITNFNIKIEDKIDNNYSCIMSSDVNGPNAHSILIKNDRNGHDWLQFIISKKTDSYYSQHCWRENKVIHDFYSIYPINQIVKIMPHGYMNSYPSVLGINTWTYGDWLLHMPGLTKEQRIDVIKEYSTKIIK